MFMCVYVLLFSSSIFFSSAVCFFSLLQYCSLYKHIQGTHTKTHARDSARQFLRVSSSCTQIIKITTPTQFCETMSRSPLNTDLTRLLKVKYPIMLAGMGGISGKELVAAVSNAGGYGVWGSAVSVKDSSPEMWRKELEEIRDMCNGKPFGVDLLVYGADGGVMKELIDVFAESGASCFISGRGNAISLVIVRSPCRLVYSKITHNRISEKKSHRSLSSKRTSGRFSGWKGRTCSTCSRSGCGFRDRAG